MSISTFPSGYVLNISKLTRSDMILQQIIPRLRAAKMLGIILGIEQGTWAAHKAIDFARQ